MSRKRCGMILWLLWVCLIPNAVSANMAAPRTADVGSTITFEQNETIAVISEALEITLEGDVARIQAVYRMKNTTDREARTQSMFLSPNVEKNETRVRIKESDVPFTVERFHLGYDTSVRKSGWEYAVLTREEDKAAGDQSVDVIRFEMEFGPREEYEVAVSYRYRLGGYPQYDFNVKYGRIDYYLTPAALWKNFENLTITVHLDKDMPLITDSTLPFKKVGARTYQYISDTLPQADLSITIDESPVQSFFSTLRSPYLAWMLMALAPYIVVAVLVLITIIWILRRRK